MLKGRVRVLKGREGGEWGEGAGEGWAVAEVRWCQALKFVFDDFCESRSRTSLKDLGNTFF